MSLLLNYYIRSLHLRRDAPFPSEVQDGHELVRRWRTEQRLKLIRQTDEQRRVDEPLEEKAS